MSAAVSTSRAVSRSSKDKLSSRQTPQTQKSNDGGGGTAVPKDKYQPTQEQLNIAQITNITNEEEVKKINQLIEMTGKNEDEVAVALLDCEDDVERAALMLLEGDNNDQGEWKSQVKKKKAKNVPTLPPPKNGNSQNYNSDKSDVKRDRSRDRDHDSSDRYDGPSRRGRRNGAPPPRFARGRGRDRNFQGDRGENGEENFENGFDNRERSGDRGRGRGRGGFGRRGRGRGGKPGGDFGGEFNSEKPSSKFDKGPQIDTWTNETAEISQKEPAGFGQTWGAEDWNEDTWTGNLKETQVFTASSVTAPEPDPITSPRNGSNSIGQRLDIGMLLQKQNEMPQQNKGNYNLSQYNQQATESIKNCIGIGAPRPQSISNLQSNQSQPLGPVGSISQSVQSNSLPSPSQALPGQTLQQRAKIAKSKLPPPSKIPASAVEMPGHRMPMLDVQFGVDFGNEPASLSFGSGAGDNTVNSRLPTVTNSPSSLTNHLPQMNSASNASESMSSSIMASPSAGSSQTVMSGLDQSSRSNSIFQNSAYPSPPKNDTQSVLNQNKITPPDPIPYATSDRKSSPLVSQRSSQQSASSMGQGSMSAPNPETNNIAFAQGASSFPSGGYQGHKSSALPGSQAYTHTTNSQSSTYQSPYQTSQNQFPSSSNQYQSSQNQYQTGQTGYQSNQNQYQTGQNQYQSGQSQFPSGQNSYSNYQSGSSFQSQSGYASNPSNPSSLYPNSSQGTNAYSGQSNAAYHMRDSQSSVSSNPTNSSQYQTQSPGIATSPAPNQSGFSAPTSQVSGGSQAGYSAQPSQTQTGYNTQPSQTQTGYNAQPSQTQSGFNAQPSQSQASFSAQSYSSSSTLQTSPLSSSKLGDSLAKMTLKDNSLDSHTSSQFDHSSTSTPSLTATTSTPSLSGGSVSSVSSSSVSAAMTTTTSSRMSSISSNSLSSVTTSKAPPNLPPGVPLVGAQYIMGQAGAVPPFYSLQQTVYPYEDQMQLLQQRVPVPNNYYDMAYQVPSSLSGRDQGTLGNVPYSVSGDSSKLNRVDAQSPNPSTQQPTSQSAHQPFIHFNYGYYYPPVLPGTAGFQIPTMYPMPTVTNTPHASTTATTQFQKTYGSHAYGTKGYDDLNQVQDYSKTAYGVAPSQTKVSAGTRTAADLAGSSYTKSHSQAFDKQGFHAGTPPPFMTHGTANQTGPMGTPTNPYAAAAPFVQMMTHNQMLHHPIQQDSSVSNRMSQQTSSQSKSGGSKAYGGAYWSTS